MQMHFKLLNAADFGVAQDRKRVIFIGFRRDLNVKYDFPEPHKNKSTLRDCIGKLDTLAVPAISKSKPNPDCNVPNHEYMSGGFSSMYMSRNRDRSWHEFVYKDVNIGYKMIGNAVAVNFGYERLKV